jgi:mannose/fructose/N-acetylgalactosamine-specific phosphotransferase system component IIC
MAKANAAFLLILALIFTTLKFNFINHPVGIAANMLEKLIAVSLWGGVVALDTTAAGQILISHPLVSCSVIGGMLGNFELGFIIGVILELVWLNELPIGAAPFSEGNIGATVAAAVAILSSKTSGRPDVVVPLALLVGVIISLVGGHLVIAIRHFNGYTYSKLLEFKQLTSWRVTRYHLYGMGLSFAFGLVLTAISVYIFSKGICAILPLVPVSLDAHIKPILPAFLGVGCGVLFYMFVSRRNWWLLLIGFGLGSIILFL